MNKTQIEQFEGDPKTATAEPAYISGLAFDLTFIPNPRIQAKKPAPRKAKAHV